MPWLSESNVESAARDKDSEVRSPVRESARELQKSGSDARQRRRRTRERIRERDRDRDDRGDQRERSGDRSYDQTPYDTRASQWHQGEDPRRRRRPLANGGHQGDESAPPGKGIDGRLPPKMSEED